jgi:hypothetical protein
MCSEININIEIMKINGYSEINIISEINENNV